MNSMYAPLFEPLVFPNGAKLDGRFAMAPMVINSSNTDGTITDADVAYFQRRAKTGNMIITAAAYNDPLAQWLDNQYAIFDDKHIPGMARIASAQKSRGAKAIMQVYHTGREADVAHRDYGIAYGPSSIQFPFLSHPVTGMSERKIADVIASFGDCVRRAVEAGFDGLEIHGANHYLIQQFFSTTANQRTDQWGGSLENRARFALAIVDEVKRVAAEAAPADFIVGYRISPEEIHGNNVGYTLDDALYLIDKVAARGVDYIHSSLWGVDSYKRPAVAGAHLGVPINSVIRDKIAGRVRLVVVGGIVSPEKALDALNYGDIVAMAGAAFAEPDLAEKIRTNRLDEITLDLRGRLDELKIPAGAKTVKWILESTAVPKESLDALDEVVLPDYIRPVADPRVFA